MVRVGLWGTFDVDDVGAALLPRVLRHELGSRLASPEVRVWRSDDRTGRSRFDDPLHDPPMPLGAWGASRTDELAVASDVLVITGELSDDQPFPVEGVGPVHEQDVPTAWLAVRLRAEPDAPFAERLRAAAARRASITAGDERTAVILRGLADRQVEVAPGLTLLADRLFRSDEPEDRVTAMRAHGLLPQGDIVVVQGSDALLPDVDTVAAQVRTVCGGRGLTPVLMASSPGDASFLDALGERLPDAGRLDDAVGPEDRCAVVAWSAGMIAGSLDLALVALAFGRPAVVVGHGGVIEGSVPADLIAATFEGGGSIGRERVAQMRASLDAHLDRIAALAGRLPATEVRERSIRSLAARLAEQESAAAERERELQVMIDQLSRRLTEGDVRFTTLWRKIRECDKHYNYQFTRAEKAEARVKVLEAQVARLGGDWHELAWSLRVYLAIRRSGGRVLRALHVLPPLPTPPDGTALEDAASEDAAAEDPGPGGPEPEDFVPRDLPPGG